MTNEIRDFYNSLKGVKVDYKVDWTETSKAASSGSDSGKLTRVDFAVDVAENMTINTVAPSITGTAEISSTLTCSDGTWTGSPIPVLTYQWLRGGAIINGATSATYVLAIADRGKIITCKVTGTNSLGVVSITTAGTVAIVGAEPVNTVAAVITGTAVVGSTLTCSDGTWTGNPTPVLTRQWLRTGTVINGATDATYVLVSSDLGEIITCTVTGTNVLGAVSMTTAGTTEVVSA